MRRHLSEENQVLDCYSYSDGVYCFYITRSWFTIRIPFLENEKISNFASIFSFALLFLSIYLVEKYSERKSLWEEIQLFSVALPQNDVAGNMSGINSNESITSDADSAHGFTST